MSSPLSERRSAVPPTSEWLRWRVTSPGCFEDEIHARGGADAAHEYMTSHDIAPGAKIYVREIKPPPPTLMYEATDNFAKYVGSTA
jgi:hypothetical protein